MMTRKSGRAASFLLAVILLLSLSVNALGAMTEEKLEETINDTAEYLCSVLKGQKRISIGSEWILLGLARSGYPVPEEYYRNYYAALEEDVAACGGVLHTKKYTEYSRVITALSAMGRDARTVAGYDLTVPLGDFDRTIWQGINGPIWALIALDSRDYPMPQNPQAATQATRQMYVDEILSRQLEDGGWSLTARGGSSPSDADITGMALQALAKYRQQPEVEAAVDKALACLSRGQDKKGGFSSMGTANAESTVQVLVALCELGISPEDSRFVKNGCTMLDNLMIYYLPGNGFLHTGGSSGNNQMATEQAFYGLVAAQRAAQGKNSLYRMGDAAAAGGEADQGGQGLPGKHADVKPRPITAPGKTFADISGANPHSNRQAIEALAARGVLNGKGDDRFEPDANMTRAEFAASVVRALDLPMGTTGVFEDVKSTDWFAAYVDTAHAYGIVNGTSLTTFHPTGTITRQEAAVMVARAAGLCGMDTGMDSTAVRNVLAQFGDYVSADSWAREGLAFCYDSDILDQSELNIQPKVAIKRCEIAQMLYHLLDRAKLL